MLDRFKLQLVRLGWTERWFREGDSSREFVNDLINPDDAEALHEDTVSERRKPGAVAERSG